MLGIRAERERFNEEKIRDIYEPNGDSLTDRRNSKIINENGIFLGRVYQTYSILQIFEQRL